MKRLAIHGGKPIRSKLLPYGHQWLDDGDIAAIVEVLKSDWLTQGPKVEEFEKRVAEYCGAKFSVAVANGTAALHAACAVAGISEGDEAITTPITFAATANAIVYCHGRPIFADIREDTLNIAPDEIRKRLTPQTKAIIPVDFAGHPADLDEITAIAWERGLVVIEDACHALGAEYKVCRVGRLADMTVFSFHPVKHITTGEGGMILTDNAEFYDKLKVLRAENIGVNVHYIPLHLHPFYQREFGYKRGDYPKAEQYYERAITLPLFPKMSDDDVEDVIKAVRKVISFYRK